MASAAKNDGSVTHTVTFEVEVPEQWIELLTQCDDIFMSTCCGYWLRGIDQDASSPVSKGWLVWEDDEKSARRGKEPNVKEACFIWSMKPGHALPPHYFSLDRAAAVKAYVEGVKLWGVDWYNSPDTDSTRYDVVIQMALLGENKYG